LNDNIISRREFGMAASAAGAGLITSSKGLAANESSGPLNYSSGLIESPPTYYEVLEPTGGSTKPPMVLISGGAHTGACYLATVDGRPGWAQVFVRAGYKVVLPDWPGVGRSGYIPLDDLTGEVVVEGLGKIVRSLGQPAIVMTHSMSGAYGWKLLENYGQHIAKLVAIAPGPPGNIQAVSDIVSETADTVVVRGSTTMTINLKQPVVSDRNLSKSSSWARARSFRASISPCMPLPSRQSRRGCSTSAAIFAAASSRSPICPTIEASAS
jgi:pimeloyl-ACP methyl ester carboxylesterase